ncbi:MAG TPA: universal stress protein [Chloroflexota bacterium]|nr:universal stress protein [Chloroflexota bacterium]
MIEQLIVALDGSPLAERALNYAVPIARGIGASVRLLSVVPNAAERGAAQDYLARLAPTVAPSGITVNATVSEGDPARVIDTTARPDRDLVVLTSHGRSGAGRWAYGTVAARVLEEGSAPVLLVRPWFAIPGLVDGGRPPAILVPLDGTPTAEAAIPVALELARGLNGEIALLGVVEQAPAAPSGLVLWGVAPAGPAREDEAVVRGYLDDLTARIGAPGVVMAPAIRVGMPATAIADAARDADATLIVMTTRAAPNSGPGPVAQELLLHDNRPVLFVRPG